MPWNTAYQTAPGGGQKPSGGAGGIAPGGRTDAQQLRAPVGGIPRGAKDAGESLFGGL